MKIINTTNRPASIGTIMLQPDEEVDVNPVEFLKNNVDPKQYLVDTAKRIGFTAVIESTTVEVEPEKKEEPEIEPPMSEGPKKKKGGKI